MPSSHQRRPTQRTLRRLDGSLPFHYLPEAICMEHVTASDLLDAAAHSHGVEADAAHVPGGGGFADVEVVGVGEVVVELLRDAVGVSSFRNLLANHRNRRMQVQREHPVDDTERRSVQRPNVQKVSDLHDQGVEFQGENDGVHSGHAARVRGVREFRRFLQVKQLSFEGEIVYSVVATIIHFFDMGSLFNAFVFVLDVGSVVASCSDFFPLTPPPSSQRTVLHTSILYHHKLYPMQLLQLRQPVSHNVHRRVQRQQDAIGRQKQQHVPQPRRVE
mmetsp:Transcript_7245/g.13155  ORF Transcript_7245/g.13155 Transcript_7245/m.13155 type:complete len:274 (-) Transcript_7245:252-1073(-)